MMVTMTKMKPELAREWLGPGGLKEGEVEPVWPPSLFPTRSSTATTKVQEEVVGGRRPGGVREGRLRREHC